MLRLFYFLSNRCSYARSKHLINTMEHDKDIRITLVITGGLLERGFEDLMDEIASDHYHIRLPTEPSDGTLYGMATAASRIARQVKDTLYCDRPDALMLWADRWELLPAAMAANYMQVPIIHIQGGEISGNVDDSVRNAVSMLSSIHMVSHNHAAKRLEDMHVKGGIYNVGCPSLDSIRNLGLTYNKGNHVIAIWHPHTNEIEDMKNQTAEVFAHATEFCKEKGLKLFWFASNNDPGYVHVHQSIKEVVPIKNMIGHDFLKLLASSRMIIGNSSAGIRESAFLGVPSVVIGGRQEGRVKADNAVVCVPHETKEAMGKAFELEPKQSNLFGDGRSSKLIVEIIKKHFEKKGEKWEPRINLVN